MDAQIFSSSATLLIAAFLLDLAIGDPHWLPHPVVLMGKVISSGEKLLRSGNARRDFLAGMALSFLLIALSAAAAWALVEHFLFIYSLAFIHRHGHLGLYDLGNPRLTRRRKTHRSPAACGEPRRGTAKTRAHRWPRDRRVESGQSPACQLGVFGRKHLRRHRRAALLSFRRRPAGSAGLQGD